jgi:hypothetical protein
MVLSGIFRPEKHKIIGDWRKVHNGELHKVYLMSNIIRTSKSRRRALRRHLACMGEACI